MVQYIANCPILGLCLDTERMTGPWEMTQLWEQEGLIFQGSLMEGEMGGYGGRFCLVERDRDVGGDKERVG